MKIRLSAFFFTALLFLMTLTPFASGEVSTHNNNAPRIVDDADLFTTQEEALLTQRIAQFQQETGMDFAILTSDQPHEGLSAQQVTDNFYDDGGYGLDEYNSGIAYFIDMYEYYHYLSTTGKMIDYMTDDRLDSVLDGNTDLLSNGEYAAAALNMIDWVEQYYLQGIPEGQYQHDVVTNEILTSPHSSTPLPDSQMLPLLTPILIPLILLASTYLF